MTDAVEPADGAGPAPSSPSVAPPDAAAHPGALEDLERQLLGEVPSLTEREVVEQAGVTVEVARELWHLLGFARAGEEEVAFSPADVRALRLTADLIGIGVLSPERQAGLVRTWGRSFARLAEWQVALLADVAAETGANPTEGLLAIADEVLPRVEELQTYAWRRHLLSVGSRMIAERGSGSASTLAVCFVDIVGYTSRSRTLSDRDLVSWLEDFESAVLDMTVDHGARIIKNIGDELLLVADSPEAMAQIALAMTRRGKDEDDPFPAVRAGVAYGEVVTRLGDVFGPVVNIAARLTSVARPCTVLVEKGMHAALRDAEDHRLRRVPRVSVKGYSRLHVWALQA